MEVDPTHPAILKDWLLWQQQQELDCLMGVKFVETHKDMCGRDHFVKLSVDAQSSSASQ